MTNITFVIPRSLPLLESLCWNVANPYKLSPKAMLDIYQNRWNYRNLANKIEDSELTYIANLTRNYQYPDLAIEKMTEDKDSFFKTAQIILENLNYNHFNRFGILWGGGSLLSTEADMYRLSLDIDFIANNTNYDLFYDWMLDHHPTDLFADNNKICTGEVRRDRIGIRFPVTCNSTTIKLEIIAEERFVLDTPAPIENQIPKLVFEDRIVSKLFANRDRWIDHSSYCRDLIDLAVLRNQRSFPDSVFNKGKRNYKIKESLIEAVERFQNKPDLRKKCYEILQIDNQITVIDGIDLLALDFDLAKTDREFNEINFDYLKDNLDLL